MLILKRLLVLVIVIAAIVLGLMLFSANTESVELDLILWRTPPVNVSIIMFGSLACGIIIGMIVMSLSLAREKLSHWSDNKRNSRSEAEARKLAEERKLELARMDKSRAEPSAKAA